MFYLILQMFETIAPEKLTASSLNYSLDLQLSLQALIY